MQTHRCKSIYIAGLAFILIAFLGGFLGAFKDNPLIDTHEHIENFALAELLDAANEATGIKKTILLASPTETLMLNGSKSFTGYRDNFDEILKIVDEYPDRFIPFCTISPMDTDILEYLQECVKRGAKGLKLYNGHSYYYEIFGIPLDSPRMMPIYAFAERNKLPILYHVNIVKYEDEFRNILDTYPDLVVSVPHFMVSSIGLDKVMALLDHYPNLYTDVSFGSPEFLAAGFRRISRDPGKYADFINDYQDRILFGGDMVITTAEKKDQDFVEEILNCYRDMLQERRYTCKPVSEYYEAVLADHEFRYENCEPKEGDYCESLEQKAGVYLKRFEEVLKLNGLGLSSSVLNKIYWKNPNRFLQANQ